MTDTYIVGGQEVTFNYDKPTFLDMISVIETVANAVVSDEEYKPYLENYLTDSNIVAQFTDVELPEDINECYAFMHESGIAGTIKNLLPDECSFIAQSVSDLVGFKKDQAAKRTKVDALIDALIHLVGTINDEFEGLDINDVLSRMEKVGFLPDMKESEIAKAIIEQITTEETSEKE